MKLVNDVSSTEVPNPLGGRLTRLTIDIDDTAVYEYIMHGAQSSFSWAEMVAREMTEKLMAWARHEDYAVNLIHRSQFVRPRGEE